MKKELLNSDKAKNLIIKLLETNDIKIELSGCGCCGSPSLKFAYKNNVIYEDDSVDINMFKKKSAKK